MEITVLHNQSLLDISIQYTGKIENAIDIAIFNGLSLSDPLSAGMSLAIQGINIDEDMVNFFKRKKAQPASGLMSDMIEIRPLSGIGYWEIENEFTVE